MKNITIKVFRPNGDFIKVWENATFKGFRKEINSGLGPCVIELGEVFNYSGNDLKLNNEVKIYITDNDTIGEEDKEKLIYSGYISRYVPWVEDKKEGITVNLLGYHTKLSQDIWKNGTTITFNYSGSATDIGTIFRSLMDRYVAESTNPKLCYGLGNIQLTSTTTEYKFEAITYRDAIDILRKLAPANWFWYVDEYGQVWFKVKDSTPTHTFILGKDFSKVRVERSMEKIKNAVLLYSDNLDKLKFYTNAGSIIDYDRRVMRMSDDRVGVEADMDKIGQGLVAEHKDPNVKVIVEILDNNEDEKFGYDIEEINPGDTCRLSGFDESLSDIFEDNMLITCVDYTLNKAIVTIEPMRAGIVVEIDNINKRVDALEKEGVPTSYTT